MMKNKVGKYTMLVKKKYILGLLGCYMLSSLTGCGKKETSNLQMQQEGSFEIVQMEVDAVKGPVGIDNEKPVFSWKFSTDTPEFTQKNYDLQVYKKDKLTGEKYLVWQSGKVKKQDTSAILYDGKPLEEQSLYLWTVTVTDSFGNTVCSGEESFSTAFFDGNAFANSSFISMNPEENVYDDGQAIVRKTFKTRDKEIKEAVLYAGSLGIYDGYVNGQRIGNLNKETGKREYDELKPGWTDYEDRLFYNTYDITEYLVKNDENAMAFMLGTGWWCGRVSQGTYGYHLPAFIGELHILYEDGTKEVIGTDESWVYRKDTAVVSADIYNGEVYDAGKVTTAQESVFLESDSDVHKPVYLPTGDVLGFSGEFQAFYGYSVKELEEYSRKPESVMAYEGAVSDNSTFGHVQEMPVVWTEGTENGPVTEADIRKNGTVSGAGIEEKDGFIVKKGQTIILDFGQNMTAVPYLQYSAKEGCEITLHFGEMLNDSGEEQRGNDGPKGSLYQANYRSAASTVKIIAGKDEIQEYQTVFSYFGFRYISITATEDVEILNIKACVIGNTSAECGTITTDNEKLNRLIENIKWSQRNNFLLVATDCPQRDERLGWAGDLQVFQKTSMFNQDLRNFYKVILTDLKDSQREDGAYPDTVPYSIVTGSGNAGWADAGISIPYNLYKQYGDITYIEEMYDSMCKYMDYLEGISNLQPGSGRVGPLTAFGDWLAFEETDKEFVSTAYYAQDAKMMAEMAEAMGKKADQRKYEKLHKKIKTYFNKTYVIEKQLTENTQTACLLAISNELIDGQVRENTVINLVSNIEKNGNKLTTGFLGTPKLLPVLANEGYIDLAYELLLNEENPSWISGVNLGATTIWERWDSYTQESGFHKDGMNSFNHFNNGSVGEFLYEFLLGISVDASQGTILINPQIPTREDIAITSCKGYYDSIYGKIQVEWNVSGNTLSYKITIPPNAKATVTLPGEDRREEENLKAGTYQFHVEIR